MLRKHKVVGKFVEFFGEGTRCLALPTAPPSPTWRPNTAPPWASSRSMKTIDYFAAPAAATSRDRAFEAYFRRRACSACPRPATSTTPVVTLDLAPRSPSLAGPKRPQDRIENGRCKAVRRAVQRSRRCRPTASASRRRWSKWSSWLGFTTGTARITEGNGDVLIAAITSCTNTSNPGVLLAAGLLAKKGGEEGPEGQAHVKTSLAPARASSPNTSEGRPAAVPGEARLQPRSATAAPPASAMPATCPEFNEAIARTTTGRAAGAVGQPQLRGAHPPQPQGQLPRQPAAGGGLRHRRQRHARPDDRAGGHGTNGKPTSSWATSGRAATRSTHR